MAAAWCQHDKVTAPRGLFVIQQDREKLRGAGDREGETDTLADLLQHAGEVSVGTTAQSRVPAHGNMHLIGMLSAGSIRKSLKPLDSAPRTLS